MKKEKKSNKCLAKKAKGITLIALVVTIVVLLILASVSITVVFGDNGLIEMAREAADKTNEAVEKDLGDIQNLTNELNDFMNPPDPQVSELLEQKASNENQEVVDKTGKELVIPAGFIVVDPEEDPTVKYEDPTSPTVDEGIVIQDGTENQFVWVPVFDETPIYTTNNGQKVGQLYDFGNSSEPKISAEKRDAFPTNGYREPDTLITYDNKELYLNIVLEEGEAKTEEKFKEQLQREFDNLIASVNKYGGFYIGRYETSGLKDDETPIVQAGKDPTVQTNWYTMYKNSKKIASQNDSVTSSMIWGNQWDAVMNWFLSSNDDEIRKYVTDSSGKGFYEQGEKTKTGSKSNYAVNNIYDMAGNVSEWTIEAIGTDYRVDRGGLYNDSGSYIPASYRSDYDPTYCDYYGVGSRATLYVNL